MKFFDCNKKNKSWYFRNYFFAGTLLIILINVLVYAFSPDNPAGSLYSDWSATLDFTNIAGAFLDSFYHGDIGHILGNMLCFLVVAVYLERKIGSINLVLLTFGMALLTSTATAANDLSVCWIGFSVVNYGLYAYVLIDYVFSFRKTKYEKQNVIFGAVVLALIYLFMANKTFEIDDIQFTWYPKDLFTNRGHYTSYYFGALLALFIQLFCVAYEWKKTDENGEKLLGKKTKILLSCFSAFIVLSATILPIVSTAHYNNLKYTVYVETNMPEYNCEIIYTGRELNFITNMEDYFVFIKWREKFGFDSDEVKFVSSSIEGRNSETGEKEFTSTYKYVNVQSIKETYSPKVNYVYIFKIEFTEKT